MTTNVEITIRTIEQQLNLSPGTIQPGGDLVKDYGADSLDIVEVVMTLEEQLDIEVPDDAVAELELQKVDNLIKYIESH
jgi:acyl carrier protein|tara:strand:+ start:253 stop:489 length:237 start_codon:yes stop_codon:yes gene_type:complete